METKEELEMIPVKERTREQHYALMKHYGGMRQYLLSMGPFLDVPWDEETAV
jgi:hypothetical protein